MHRFGPTRSVTMYELNDLDSQEHHCSQSQLQVHCQLHHHAESWLRTQHFGFLLLGQWGWRHCHYQVGRPFTHMHRQCLRMRTLIKQTIYNYTSSLFIITTASFYTYQEITFQYNLHRLRLRSKLGECWLLSCLILAHSSKLKWCTMEFIFLRLFLHILS